MVWRKIRDALKRLGKLEGTLYLLTRFFQVTTGNRIRLVRYYLVAQPIPKTDKRSPRDESTRSRTALIERDNPIVASFPRPPKINSARFDAGHVCFTTTVGDRFAGHLWLARGGYDEDEVRCRYEFDRPELSAWDFDVYVAPQFRISRAFSRLWDTANRHMDAAGVRWSFSRISAFSEQSLRSHAKLGTHALYSATFLCAGRLQISFVGVAPFVHFSLSDRSRPVLRLAPPRGPSNSVPLDTDRAPSTKKRHASR